MKIVIDFRVRGRKRRRERGRGREKHWGERKTWIHGLLYIP